jgi:hypothetical protein
MIFKSFVGPSNVLRSPFQDAEDTINFCLESTSPGVGKTPKALVGVPCIQPFAEGPGIVRQNGLFYLNGRSFGVFGAFFCEISEMAVVTNYGSVGTDGLPVSIASNGSAGDQILIISNELGFIFDIGTDTLTQITDPDFPMGVGQCEFMDGYFLVTIKNTRRFQISALEDGTSWDALDVGEISEAADNIVSMKRNHREIWFHGSQTAEVWYDNGDPLFPFAPIQGVFIETGAAAAFGVVRADNTLFWIDRDERGNGIIRKADGYTPTRVSTYGIEQAISITAIIEQTNAFAIQTRGHLFVWFFIPDAHWALVYDAAEDAWHKQGLWDPIICHDSPNIANSHMFAFGRHLVGSPSGNWVYEMSWDFYEDILVA